MHAPLAITLILSAVAGGARSADPIQVTSPAFAAGAPIPTRYSSYGENHSPPLSWTSVPGAKAYVLTVLDPDAPSGTFTHWLMWNIPGTALEQDERPAGAREGRNDINAVGYFGPRPPYGRHRYRFAVFALDTPLDLPAGANLSKLNAAMRGHVLAKGELVGTYAK